MTMVFTQSMTSVTKVTKWWNQHPRWDQHRVESFHTPSLSIGLNHDQIPGIALMLFLLCNDSSFQNVIFMAVTNRSNRPYLTYSIKKKLRPTLPNQLLRGIILAPREKSLHLRNSDDEVEPGFVGHMQPLPVSRRHPGWSEWNSEDFWCWGLEVMVGFV